MNHRQSKAAAVTLAALAALAAAPGPAAAFDLARIDDWAYQLQGYDANLAALAASAYDLAVIDYSSDGGATGEFSPAEIAGLRHQGPCGDRIALAYLSIGEAEDYRYYFDPDWIDGSGQPIPGVAPAWLGPTNEDWPGNYKVRYWDPAWQAILFGTTSGADQSYLDRILDQGFDGVYLDIIDAFEFWGPVEIGGSGERPSAPSDMIDLVSALAAYAAGRGLPDFLIVPQNGAGIISEDSYPGAADPAAFAAAEAARYFAVVDAIGAEDTFFYGEDDEDNPYDPQTYVIELLARFRAAGKVVLSVEYLTEPEAIDAFYASHAPAQGFIPHATVRALDRLSVNPGHEPDCSFSGVRLEMPGRFFGPGSPCGLMAVAGNPGPALAETPFFVVLDVYGEYVIGPDFAAGAGWTVELAPGRTDLAVVPAFSFPAGAGTAAGLAFYGAVTDPAVTAILGELGVWEFGFAS